MAPIRRPIAAPARSLGREGQGHLAMLVFSALVGGSFSLGARMADLVDPVAFTALRFWLAALVIGAGLGATGRIGRPRAPWRQGVLGLLYAIYFVLMFEGLKTAAPVSASAVFTLTPLMAAGFGWLLLRQRLSPRIAAALALGGAGALWVIFRADLSALLQLELGRGEAIYLVGCVAHALYTPLVARLNRGESAPEFALGVVLARALLLTVFGGPALLATDWAALPPIVWATLLYVAIFASAATMVLLQFAALRLPSAKVMAYTYLVPAWVLLWEAGFGAALPRALVLLGVAMTAAALLLLLRPERP
ncbi:Integral membrane protein [Rubellimicrobium mesophilum DSM 19309]|uniref:Integral membrane protein n=1 Tax=Rubellimicrobium mesophilum DSM 19309 TaxID=442562 RepID=A0A017HW34_9RHOB|nr:DMT family transporter [Rubellimicrobium mesophilum]EYD77964.1 Integral membrane protein [Rubellimicrobium mesophilum DSM 19309]